MAILLLKWGFAVQHLCSVFFFCCCACLGLNHCVVKCHQLFSALLHAANLRSKFFLHFHGLSLHYYPALSFTEITLCRGPLNGLSTIK